MNNCLKDRVTNSLQSRPFVWRAVPKLGVNFTLKVYFPTAVVANRSFTQITNSKQAGATVLLVPDLVCIIPE